MDHEYCESAVALSSFLVILDLRDLPALRTLLMTRCCVRARLVYSSLSLFHCCSGAWHAKIILSHRGRDLFIHWTSWLITITHKKVYQNAVSVRFPWMPFVVAWRCNIFQMAIFKPFSHIQCLDLFIYGGQMVCWSTAVISNPLFLADVSLKLKYPFRNTSLKLPIVSISTDF